MDNDHKLTTVLTRDLIRQQPEQAREIFDALPLRERADLVMSLHGRQRLDLIQISAESTELVQALPEPEFWITLKEVGEEDAVELLKAATPEQLIHLSDLEWWHQGAIDPLPVAYWLMLLAEAGSEASLNWFRNADEELLVAAFARFFLVYKTDPDNEGAEPWRNAPNLWTLDGTWYISFFDPNAAPILERFLSFVRAEEGMRYYGLLDLVEMSAQAEQEDSAHDFRTARLADFGFVDFDEALEIYTPVSDGELRELRLEKAGTTDSLPPRFPLALSAPPPLLALALAQLTDQATFERVALGLAALVSRILVADALDMTRIETLTVAVTKAQAFVELGLERVSGGDPEKAALALSELHPFALFRAGYTRVIKAARRAEGLLRAGWPSRVKTPKSFLGEDGLLLEGLTRLRPLYYAGAADDGAPAMREFRTRDEVERAERAASRVEVLGLLFFEAMTASDEELARLSGSRPDGSVSWREALATGAAQAFAGNDFRFAPLSLADARVALENMLTPERPRSLRSDVAAALTSRARTALGRLAAAGPEAVATGAALVEEALEQVAEEAEDLDLAALDGRFFRSLLIQVSRSAPGK